MKWKALTFLLVDDDEDDRELFQIALEEVEHDIHYLEAASGVEALRTLRHSDTLPDYIFLDLNMPHMNGRECLIELKKDPRLTAIPVIIFSTSNDPRDIEETKILGAIEFITKPHKTSILTTLLKEFIISQLNTINE
jgi:CheY-like chemotaxis protein